MTENELLDVVPKLEDVRRRRKVAALLVLIATALIGILVAVIGAELSLPLYMVALVLGLALVIIGGFILVRERIHVRVLIMARLPRIRAHGKRVDIALSEGRLDEVELLLKEALQRDRELGAFHARNVLLFGVLRHLQSRTDESLELMDQALESGWLDTNGMIGLKTLALEWKTFVLLSLGRIAEARSIVDDAGPAFITSPLALAAYEERWVDLADRAASQLQTAPDQAKPVIALLGAYAAKQVKDPRLSEFEAVLQEHPLRPVSAMNPTLVPFLK